MALRYDRPVDTHCHLNDETYSDDIDDVIKGIENELAGCICVGYDLESSEKGLAIAQKHSTFFSAVGVHPHDAESMDEGALHKIKALLKEEKVVALGEIGLDYHYDNSERDVQKQWFIRQLELALEEDVPVIIHLRDAYKDMMDILHSFKVLPRGVMHCFSGSAEIARETLDMGFYISFSGAITFKNAVNLKEVVRTIPADRLLVETDAPYLTPAPHRGERNRPEHVRFVAEQAASLRQEELSELIERTTQNAITLFELEKR